MARSILTTRRQSGDDWGMGDDDDMFGTDIMNMDPDSQEFRDAMAAEMGEEPPKIPGEVNNQGFSTDFTDSGEETETDQPLSLEEISYDLLGPDALPDKDVPGVTGWRQELSRRGGMGAADGSAPKSGILRRDIRKKSKSLISNRGQATV